MRTDPAVDTMVPTIATVEAVRPELDDTVTLSLALSEPSLPPSAGQFAMLWAPGVGEVPISYAGIGDGHRVDHTIRAVGATSRALATCEPGATIGTRGPFGRGWDLAGLAGRDVLIIAGGLGLAPLRPVIEMAADGALEAASVQLLIGARSPDVLLYADEIQTVWSGLSPRVTVDHATEQWHAGVGPVTILLDQAMANTTAPAALVCGPEIMMRVVAHELVNRSVEPRHIQISLERNMQCGVGRCGHCQLGPLFTCVDSPVATWEQSERLLEVAER